MIGAGLLVGLFLAVLDAPAPSGESPPALLVVVGAPGTAGYEAELRAAAERWRKAAKQAELRVTALGLDSGGPSDRERLEKLLAGEAKGSGPFWLVLLGHGTFDGRTAKFNLRGPDVSAEDLAAWLAPFSRPIVFINGASSSAPFLKALSAPNRTIVTATKTGFELNATRLPRLLSEAIADPTADLDRDGRVSLFEAFVVSSRRVEASFAAQGQLASEHALLDDNGDGLGTAAKFFEGLRAAHEPDREVPLDGHLARKLFLAPLDRDAGLTPAVFRRRQALEAEVERLRAARDTMPAARYYSRLEGLLVTLARLYETAAPSER